MKKNNGNSVLAEFSNWNYESQLMEPCRSRAANSLTDFIAHGEEDVPHHTFPLPSERNIHAVIRGVPATLKEADIKEELQQKGYAPLHIIRLKRSGAPMPLVVVILPKLEKSPLLRKGYLNVG
nr:unnamed protein product [Callosobruchus analis]